MSKKGKSDIHLSYIKYCVCMFANNKIMAKVQNSFIENYYLVGCKNEYKKGGCCIPADIPEGCLTDYENYANIGYVLKIVDDKTTDEYLTPELYESIVQEARERADWLRVLHPELNKWSLDRVAFEIMASAPTTYKKEDGSTLTGTEAYRTNIKWARMKEGDKLLKVSQVVEHKNKSIEDLLAMFR